MLLEYMYFFLKLEKHYYKLFENCDKEYIHLRPSQLTANPSSPNCSNRLSRVSCTSGYYFQTNAVQIQLWGVEPSSDTTDQYITTHTCSEYKTLILLFTLVIRDNSGLPGKTYQRAFYVFKINYITDRTRNTNTAIFLNVPYGLSTKYNHLWGIIFFDKCNGGGSTDIR